MNQKLKFILFYSNILCGRNEPLVMELKGLKCMQKNFTKAKVLYIDVQEKSGLLQKIVEEMRSYFIQKGFKLNIL